MVPGSAAVFVSVPLDRGLGVYGTRNETGLNYSTRLDPVLATSRVQDGSMIVGFGDRRVASPVRVAKRI